MVRTLFLIKSLLVVAVLAGCATPEVARGINDPNEDRNRKVHAFNKKLDRGVLRPLSGGYGSSVPAPVQKGIGNFASNLATPGYVVNDLLQGNIDDAAANFTRFLFNSTIGVAGVFDPMGSAGLHTRESDFGETLHVWGFGEGPYGELPLLGPSTRRHTVGRVVDLFTNPLGYSIPKPERYALPATGGLAGLGARYRFGDVVDSILYDSADSYAQARLLYLDNRRFKLSGGVETEDDGPEEEYDPNANPFADYD